MHPRFYSLPGCDDDSSLFDGPPCARIHRPVDPTWRLPLTPR